VQNKVVQKLNLIHVLVLLHGKNNHKVPKEIITIENFLSDMTWFVYDIY